MALYRPEKWRTSKAGLLAHRALGELFENVNSLSIRATVQKLCLPEVRLPFLNSSNFAATSNATSGAFCFGGGCQIAHSRMYS